MLYDRKEMHHIPICDIQFTIPDQLFLLMKIKNTKSKEQEEQLEESIKPFGGEKKIKKYVQSTAKEKKTTTTEYLKLKLIEIRSKRMDDVLLRSRSDGYWKVKKCKNTFVFH